MSSTVPQSLPLCFFSRGSTGPDCSTCMLSGISLLFGLASPSPCVLRQGFASAFLVSLLDLACDVELLLPPC